MRIRAPQFPPRTVRGRVSLALNATLIGLFVLFLAYDYRHDSDDRLRRKRTALEEQARIVLPGIRGLAPDVELVARLGEIRRQMSESHADAHVIAVEVNGTLFQSGLAGTPKSDGDTRFRDVPVHAASSLNLDDRDFLVGSHQEGATTVYIAEDLQEVRTAIRADMVRHLASVVVVLVCVTLIINGVLWLALHRPLCALATAVGDIGSGKFGVQIEPVGAEEFDVLVGAVNGMSRALAVAEESRSVQMRKARAVQGSLLPAHTLLDGFVIGYHFEPTDAVGGDYFDLLVLPDGSGLICVADVSGHGVSAALVAAVVKVCLLNAAEHEYAPGAILERVDRRLSALNIPDTFVSMILIRLGGPLSDIEYAGAGHPPAVLVDPDGRCRELESDGPVLGLGTGAGWETRREAFDPGDRLVLFTDGVTEASGAESLDLFGLDRLKHAVAVSHGEVPAHAIKRVVEKLHAHLKGHPAQDDVTLVIVDRRGTAKQHECH